MPQVPKHEGIISHHKQMYRLRLVLDSVAIGPKVVNVDQKEFRDCSLSRVSIVTKCEGTKRNCLLWDARMLPVLVFQDRRGRAIRPP